VALRESFQEPPRLTVSSPESPGGKSMELDPAFGHSWEATFSKSRNGSVNWQVAVMIFVLIQVWTEGYSSGRRVGNAGFAPWNSG
jgi:hypothetical protein